MEALGITGVQALLLVGAVMGFVELVKKLFEKDWKSAIIIFGAGLVGGLVSLFPEMEFTFLTGVVGGLTASGVVSLAHGIGKSTPVTEVVVAEEDAKK